MRARTFLAALTLACAAALPACDGNSFDAGEYDVEGDWAGTVETPVGTPVTDTVRYTIALSLTQEETFIGGTGELRAESQTVPLEVDGDWDFPSVTFTLRGPGIVPIEFTGSWDRDTLPPIAPDTARRVVIASDSIIGTLSGSGITSARLAIARQPDP